LAAWRRRLNGKCQRCGKEVLGLTTRRFCSAACRVAAARERASTRIPADFDRQIALIKEISARVAQRSRGKELGETGADLIRSEREARERQLWGE
jgi:hypothetical protein